MPQTTTNGQDTTPNSTAAQRAKWKAARLRKQAKAKAAATPHPKPVDPAKLEKQREKQRLYQRKAYAKRKAQPNGEPDQVQTLIAMFAAGLSNLGNILKLLQAATSR